MATLETDRTDAKIMGRSTPANIDRSTFWLASLIEAMDKIGSSTTSHDPSAGETLFQRLHLPALLKPRATVQ
jgi:hypothetical protein